MKLVIIILGALMKLVLTGFMGAGKTTLQEKWEGNFPGPCLDLDHLIAVELGISRGDLGRWIEVKGFPEFRKKETLILERTLKNEPSFLLALGGGAFTTENIELIKKEKSRSIWLKVDPEVCWSRVHEDENRPLVKTGKDAFLALYKEREPLYQKADFIIPDTYPVPSWEEFCKSYNLLG